MGKGRPVKRLSGWDSVLLYSEAPNVHMHTLKVAVIELDADRQDFDLDRLSPRHRQPTEQARAVHVPAGRHSVQVPPPHVARALRGRPRLPHPPVAATRAGWSPRAGRGDRTDRQHPPGPGPSAVGDVFRRRTGQQPGGGGRQDPPRARRRHRFGEPDGPRHGLGAHAGERSANHRPGPIRAGADDVGIQRPFAADRKTPGDDALHHAGYRPGPTQLAQALTRTDHALHTATNFHQSQAHPRAQVRHRHTGPQPMSRRPARSSGRRSTMWCWPSPQGLCARCCCATTAKPIRCWLRCR